MKITYTVHSCVQTQTTVRANFGGQEVDALVPALVVELVSDDGSVSHVLRQVPVGDQAMQDALQRFTVGNKITGSFDPTA